MNLPLTIPVHSIVLDALRSLKESEGLDRDEAYLLARLEETDDPETALRLAMDEAPR